MLDCSLESEIAQLPENERAEYLGGLGLEERDCTGFTARRLISWTHHLQHGGSEGSARLDDHEGDESTASGRRDPYGFRKRIHLRRVL